MKSLFLIRHAKSSWDSLFQEDFERPLNDRGIRDAPRMARMLHSRGIFPDLLLSSSANRAQSTAILFCREYDIEPDQILLTKDLYHADPNTINRVVQSLNDSYNVVFLFAHNPGMTDWINRFTDAKLDNLPTCGVAEIEHKSDIWNDFASQSLNCKNIWYPKMLS
jgi:phosphohistidine phosphatase